MPVTKGRHLGGIDSIEALRLRCVCRDDDDCWHYRSAHGKPMKRGAAHKVFVYGHGSMTVGQAIWLLQNGAKLSRKKTNYRTCDSYDCANPEHFKAGARATYVRRAMKDKPVTAERRAPLMAHSLSITKATKELRQWIAESPQGGPDIAHALDMSRGNVNRIRREMRARPASVFHLGASTHKRTRSANSPSLQEAA